MKLSYIRLLTDCFPEMFDFYSKVIGLTCKLGTRDDDYAEFLAGDVKLALFKRDLMAKALDIECPDGCRECDDKQVIILQVDDVEKVAEDLKAKGQVFLAGVTERKEWGVKTLHVRDPSGNILEINTPIPME